MNKKLKSSYFQSKDTLALSKNLLGKFLVSSIGGIITSGMIIETESYMGEIDRASHAFGNRRTKRTETMFLAGGHWYVYLCYGMHHLLNIVTHDQGVPHAILIRALQPVDGIETMLKRRNMSKLNKKLTSGPGSLSVALGIDKKLDGEEIGKSVWIEDRGVIIPENKITIGPRIGVAYAKEDALLPYRFTIS